MNSLRPAVGRPGTFGEYGGRYVPETLIPALEALEKGMLDATHDASFQRELGELLSDFGGRPTPLMFAERLSNRCNARVFLKREDLLHTGAHKLNNTLGQCLLARRMGKSRVIAETGAGQHGVATAAACAKLGLACEVFMGAVDVERQAPNVQRMKLLGARVHPVASGDRTLKDAMNEALRDWVTHVRTTFYCLGSVAGPHPYPTLVRDLQRVIGDEARAQLLVRDKALPDAVVACIGGGSNAMGLFTAFLGDPTVRLWGVEAAGDGLLTERHAASLAKGQTAILHGSRSAVLQDAHGQVAHAHSISAGLDYPGVGPELAALRDERRLSRRAQRTVKRFWPLLGFARTRESCPRWRAARPRPRRGHRQGAWARRPDHRESIGARRQGPDDRAGSTRCARWRADGMTRRRIDHALVQARAERRSALVVYLCAGDPDLAATERLVPRFIQAGADVIELGVPFSDPIADGPVIQAASERSLAKGTTLEGVLALVHRLRGQGCDAAIALMSYLNPIHALGDSGAIARAGVDGLILPDLPFDDAAPWTTMRASVADLGMDLIPLAAPTTPPNRLATIGGAASGFLYFVSVTGVTGTRASLPPELPAQLAAARAVSRVPVAVGFGIDSPAQARALAEHADGVIVGSALVRLLSTSGEDAAVDFVHDLSAALKSTEPAPTPHSRAHSC